MNDNQEARLIWGWNDVVPGKIDTCLHTLVMDLARQQPEDLAVDAWDGQLTFAELDDLSTLLSYHLIELGVKAESMVPLCFEKSVWTVVTMLAILKSGAAFVPLDPAQPAARRERVLDEVKADVVLASSQHLDLVLGGGHVAVCVSRSALQALTARAAPSNYPNADRALPEVSPASAAYVIFTSGSTGVPKGVILEHSAVSTSCMANGKRMGYQRESRVLQFASYTFDACIMEIMTTLVHGACVCVPSESQRVESLATTICDMNINFAILTTSVSRSLKPEDVPCLQVLTLVGEAISAVDCATWGSGRSGSGISHLMNGYGPTECCVSCAVADIQPGSDPRTIGKAVGSVGWVVDPDDDNKLAPFGTIGELLIEGPILARGYLKDIQTGSTSAAFIQDPIWLLAGAPGYPGRRGRLYKTGDLVKYNPDGSFQFHGRKDTQVKVRGQRVELAEVEGHVRDCMPDVVDVVAEVVSLSGSKPMLAVFVQLKDATAKESTITTPGQGSVTPLMIPVPLEVEKKLVDRLPTYMVPSVYFTVARMPMSISGKTDRKTLRESVAAFSFKQLAEVQRDFKGAAKQQPTTEMERQLQQLWSQILNVEIANIGVDDSFFRLGGDSITAMQLSSAARSIGITLTTRDTFQAKTISLLARVAKAARPKSPSESRPDSAVCLLTSFELSPIQQLFFQINPETGTSQCFDQYFFLKLAARVTPTALTDSVRTVIRQHPMLRARFSTTPENQWSQFITDEIEGSYHLEFSEATSAAKIRDDITRCREALNIETGPLVSAVLFDDGSSQSLFITVHHLVVDLVSWRVILQDLEELLVSQKISSFPTMTFQSWCQRQKDYAQAELDPRMALPFDVHPTQTSYWGLDVQKNILGNTTTQQFTLDQTTTSRLLGAANHVFQTEPVELMIATLIHSFGQVFADRPSPAIFSEGHGRETWDSSFDISRTVGWFTTIFPVQMSKARQEQRDVFDAIREVKDCMRSLPQKGWSYFTSRFLNDDGIRTLAHDSPMEIVFNYQGLYQSLEGEKALFHQQPLPDGTECHSQSAMRVKRFSIFDIDAQVNNGRLEVSFSYNADIPSARVCEWVTQYEKTIKTTLDSLDGKNTEWTLSDFPLAFSQYSDLSIFQDVVLPTLSIDAVTDIEDIFPCSPVQEGILISQIKEPSTYRVCFNFEILSAFEGRSIDIKRLQRAWEAVVQRHAILRSIFVENLPGHSGPAHVILKSPKPSVSLIQQDGICDIQWFRKFYDPIVGQQSLQLQHHLSICEGTDGRIVGNLEANHAILDGFSRHIIFSDLRAAYDNNLSPIAPSYSGVISHLQQRSHNLSADTEYWTNHLAGVKSCSFPDMSDKFAQNVSIQTVKIPHLDAPLIHNFCREHEISFANIVQLVWALILSRYAGTSTPCFGSLISGRDIPVDGIEEIVGPVINMIACRVDLDGMSNVVDVLHRIRSDYVEGLSHQAVSLSRVQNALGLGSQGLFNTAISIQKGLIQPESLSESLVIQEINGYDPTEYDVYLNAEESSTTMSAEISYRGDYLSKIGATNLALTFHKAISLLTANPYIKLRDLDILSDQDYSQAFLWNNTVPTLSEQTVDQLFCAQVQNEPGSPAICSWDGDLTYQGLDDLSTRLGQYLIELGVTSEVMVPLCFEKSMWFIVAMLGVLKAGGAFVPLDPSTPAKRRETIFEQVDCQVVLTSPQYEKLISTTPGVRTVLSVSRTSIERLPATRAQSSNRGISTSPAYVIFTSGSTSNPKGVVLEHGAVSTGCLAQGDRLRLGRYSRVLQFSSYAFDACIMEIITTLLFGGCVCVPSDSQRLALAETINDMDVTFAVLTPSVSRLIEPKTVPSLQSLLLGGEALSESDLTKWSGIRQLINGYGPTECCVCSVAHEIQPGTTDARIIGTAIGSATWIVDVDDHNKLAPLGVIGELLIEGPILAREYLNDPKKTAASFIESPPWLESWGRRSSRLYKTGDLVRYNSEGSLQFVGRKDTQVKIRGQRVELGEVEHHIRQCMPEMAAVAAEVIVPAGKSSNAILVAFLQLEVQDEKHDATTQYGSIPPIMPVAPEARAELVERLPSYMIPAIYFNVVMPALVSGKTDRKALRQMVSTISEQQIADMQRDSNFVKRLPSTELEQRLQKLWGQILGIEATSVNLDDSFFQLGGDSITAMKLSGEAWKSGIILSVPDIFRYPTLSSLAGVAIAIVNRTEETILPFSLLPASMDESRARVACSALLDIHPDAIQDIYPCTPLQEGLLSLTTRRSGEYTLQYVLRLSSDLRLDDFCRAWEETIQSTTILRTRIVPFEGLGLQQVVLKENILWLHDEDLKGYLERDEASRMGLGRPLSRYAIIKDKTKGDISFVWTLHHALYDGWSIPLVLDMVNRKYRAVATKPHRDFNAFVKYLTQKKSQEEEEFWESRMSKPQYAPFPPLPRSVREVQADTTIKHSCPLPSRAKSDITSSTLIRAAWAMIPASYTASEDVVFGVTVSGRNASIFGVQDIVGPLIATVPIRVDASARQTVSNYLQTLQDQASEMIPFEQTGLQNIARFCKETQQACDFQTLLVVHPPEELQTTDNSLGEWLQPTQHTNFNTYALTLQCVFAKDAMEVEATFDSRVVSSWEVTNMLCQFSSVLEQLSTAGPEQSLEKITVPTRHDIEKIWHWNATLPDTVEVLVHRLIQDQASSQPMSPAICGWDGNLTYSELDKLSTRLAHHLLQFGIGPDILVPICFEKSMWAIVAMLGVLKAGGAFVPIDPTMPIHRKETVLRQVPIGIMLTSVQMSGVARESGRMPVLVDQPSIDNMKTTDGRFLDDTNENHAAYVIFTSGTTGEPKGVVLEHHSVSTSCLAHGKLFALGKQSRVLQFSVYTFDACIMEIFTTLLYGGCICIPSTDQRLEDLASIMNGMDVNFAMLTPSVARVVNTATIKSLQALVLTGEAITDGDWERWSALPHLINAGGPTECCIICNVHDVELGKSDCRTIGKPSGSLTWLVDPHDHNKLAPLGAIGEVLVEGPILARGYLNDVQKTTAAFIEDPTWLLDGPPGGTGRSGRLYKSGDLGKYTADGSLVMIGRKDTQVKIRGQRMELGEVEFQLRKCMPNTVLAVEIIAPAGEKANPLLAAFIELKEESTATEPQLVPIPVEIEAQLADSLPGYMVPSICFAVPKIPMTVSGKTDRKALRGMVSLSAQQLAAIQHDKNIEKRMPSTEMEQRLQQLWAQVLNIDPTVIGVDDSFFKLGGDSIAAMQLSSVTRAAGINLSTSDVFKAKTIGMLARVIKAGGPSSSDTRNTSKELHHQFKMSPIQQLFFQVNPDTYKYFDQYFYLKLTAKVSSSAIISSIREVVQQHPMLRARFTNENGQWLQAITDDTDGSYQVTSLDATVRTSEEMRHAISSSREGLNIETGPLLSAVLFNNGEGDTQHLFITIHHAVVDLVSWRVILHDIEELLKSRKNTHSSMSFQSWCQLQEEHARIKLSPRVALPFDIQSQLTSYWGTEDTSIAQTTMPQFTLDKATTSRLLSSGNNAFQTDPIELMIATLLYSFKQVFTDRQLPTIFSEGHGREVWDESLDVSRTVGWFTTMFPVQVSKEGQDTVFDIIRQVKDCIRSLPQKGWSYFTSRFLNSEGIEAFKQNSPAEIIFNYQGLYQTLEGDKALFQQLPLPDGPESELTLQVKRFAIFDIDAQVIDGCLTVSFIYNKNVRNAERVQEWTIQYEAAIKETLRLLESRATEWTISDFPLAFNQYTDLSTFREMQLASLGIAPAEVEDVFPCSPIQEGILISQIKEPNNYRPCFVFEVLPCGAGTIDLNRLEKAWSTVVQRHSILRSLLVESLPGRSGYAHIVLKNPKLSVYRLNSQGGNGFDIIRSRQHHDPVVGQQKGLQHHLSILEIADGRVYCGLEMNHAIIDGFSKSILFADLQTAYENTLNPIGPSYRKVISFLQDQSHGASFRYWKKYLTGVEPCYFPNLGDGTDQSGPLTRTIEVKDLDAAQIHDFCRRYETSPANVIQAAWALVLQRYTGANAPCFGYLLSGRDLPIDSVNEIVGPLINVVICSIALDRGSQDTSIDVLHQIRSDYAESLEHQTLPLASVQGIVAPGSSSIFNTVVSIQKSGRMPEFDSPKTGIIVQEVDGYDPTEYDVSLNALESDDFIGAVITYRNTHLSESAATALAHTFSRAISLIVLNPDRNMSDLDILSEQDYGQVFRWNSSVPIAASKCVHELVAGQASSRLESPAICAWDGDLLYGELDELSSRLAHHLIQLGVGPDVMVPLYFEKSMWTIVAMLAVLKAGGAFVPLEPTHPVMRRGRILKQVDAQIALASSQYSTLAKGEVHTVFYVCKASIQELPTMNEHTLPSVAYDSIIYAFFTSGSTGEPKGVVLNHNAVATSCLAQGERLQIGPESRVFQFSSYTFDACIFEIMTTLIHGGCICVPSETDRMNNPAKPISELRANWAQLTPPVIRLIDPINFASFEGLIVTGEAPRPGDCSNLQFIPQLINGYGPTESTVMCLMHDIQLEKYDVRTVGKALKSSNCWVVDAHDHNKLAPVGAVGELLIEGPTLARGYLNDSEKTMAAFIEDPSWLMQMAARTGEKRQHTRLYKTGDLVKYNPGGTIRYIGRKDTQIKVRGQRVELGEVEYHLREVLQHVASLIAEIIIPAGENASPVLAAFLQPEETESSHTAHKDDLLQLTTVTPQLEAQLAERLPSYMVPSVYFAVQKMPLTVAGKTDRKVLRSMASKFSAQQLAEMEYNNSAAKRHPVTDTEKKLQQLWGQVLGIDPSVIGLDDSFFRLGGDSIAAMKLARETTKAGLSLTVADMFHHPSLEEHARHSIPTVAGLSNALVPEPFSFINTDDLGFDLPGLYAAIDIKPQDVFEILPATDSQSMFINLGMEIPRQGLNYLFLDIGSSVDVERLLESCRAVVEHFAILRTIFVSHLGKVWQIFLHKVQLPLLVYDVDEDLTAASTAICLEDTKRGFELGRPFVSFTLVRHKSMGYRLIIRISHAQYDGFSMPLLLRALENAYMSKPLGSTVSFSTYTSHAFHQKTTSCAYWRQLLAGSRMTNITTKFATSLLPGIRPSKIQASLCIKMPPPLEMVTMASLFSSAWSLVLSNLTKEKDVVYGTLVSGRNATSLPTENILGPCINFVPVRVQFDAAWTTRDLLRCIQDQQLSMGQADSLGFNDIASTCTEWHTGTKYDSIVQYQNVTDNPEMNLSGLASKVHWFDNPHVVPEILTIFAVPRNGQLELKVFANSGILDVKTADGLLNLLSQAMESLSGSPDRLLGDWVPKMSLVS